MKAVTPIATVAARYGIPLAIVVAVVTAACASSPVIDKTPRATADDRAIGTSVAQLATRVDQLSIRVDQLATVSSDGRGGTVQTPVAQTTATAQPAGGLPPSTGVAAEFATAQAQATVEAGYVAWRDRLNAAAVSVSSCSIARHIASSTTSFQSAFATAQAIRSARPVGFCPDTPTAGPAAP